MSLDPHQTVPTIWRDFDLSEVTERFRLKSPSGSMADELERETRRFLWMSAKNGRALVPSDLVDEYWHALILNTAMYRQYCERAFGFYIEHSNGIPDMSQEALHAYLDAYRETLKLYQTEFHVPAPSSCWPHPDRRISERLARYRNPYRLHLETTNHCNLRCEHCDGLSAGSAFQQTVRFLLRLPEECFRGSPILDARAYVVTAEDLARRAGYENQVIDLGFGSASVPLYFLERGWQVTAIDRDPTAVESLERNLRFRFRRRLTTICTDFRKIDFQRASLVHPGYSLQYVQPGEFHALWGRLAEALYPGGVFAGHFFGMDDQFARHDGFTVLAEGEIHELLSGWRIVYWDEYNGAGQRDPSRWWHFHTVVAQRDAPV